MILHYDSGRYYHMPVSGTHIRSSCGISFQYSYKPDRKRYTKDKDSVTCKKCIKAIKPLASA